MSRLELQTMLEELLGSKNVYYQPPSDTHMRYPAIRYSKSRIDFRHASDSKYLRMNCYNIIVIDYDPDNPVIEELLKLPYCTYDRHYVSNNLNHDSLTIYI